MTLEWTRFARRSPRPGGAHLEDTPIHGAILIWGDVSNAGRRVVRRAINTLVVLSLRDIIDDLVTWNDRRYRAFVDERMGWCQHLFAGLQKEKPPTP